MSVASAINLNPNPLPLNSFNTSTLNAVSYPFTGVNSDVEVLDLGVLPAGTYFFSSNIGVTVNQELVASGTSFYTTGAVNILNSTFDSLTTTDAVVQAGISNISTSGVVTFASPTQLYVGVGLTLTTPAVATTWTPSSVNISYIQLA